MAAATLVVGNNGGVDWTVVPGSRISRLPAPLRYPALAVRNLGVRPRQPWLYESDGLATTHHSPFLEDREWARLYDEMAADWFTAYRADVRWRMWLLTTMARQAQALEGNFAEFGVYRGGCAFMILATTEHREGRRFFLFDTFAGIPDTHLTEEESSWGIAGMHADTSAAHVERFLGRWEGRFETCPGDVFETLGEVDTGPLSLAHIDLNSGAATKHVLEYVYPRLVAGGVVVFDDYGQSGGAPQREVIDAFFAGRTEQVVVLPTGQAMAIKQ
jgi:O-methyltransferase